MGILFRIPSRTVPVPGDRSQVSLLASDGKDHELGKHTCVADHHARTSTREALCGTALSHQAREIIDIVDDIDLQCRMDKLERNVAKLLGVGAALDGQTRVARCDESGDKRPLENALDQRAKCGRCANSDKTMSIHVGVGNGRKSAVIGLGNTSSDVVNDTGSRCEI